jgi:hypothetical protein
MPPLSLIDLEFLWHSFNDMAELQFICVAPTSAWKNVRANLESVGAEYFTMPVTGDRGQVAVSNKPVPATPGSPAAPLAVGCSCRPLPGVHASVLLQNEFLREPIASRCEVSKGWHPRGGSGASGSATTG